MNIEDYLSFAILFGVVLIILIFVSLVLYIIAKIMEIKELQAEALAYQLIQEEEELNIRTLKEREKRDAEMHKEKMKELKGDINYVYKNQNRRTTSSGTRDYK